MPVTRSLIAILVMGTMASPALATDLFEIEPEHSSHLQTIAGCPPGLAKKSPSCVPPGLARKTEAEPVYSGYRYDLGDRVAGGFVVVDEPSRYGL